MTYERECGWNLTTLGWGEYTPTMLEVAAVFMGDPAQPRWAYEISEITGIVSSAVRSTLARMVDLAWLTRAEQDLDALHDYADGDNHRAVWIVLVMALLVMTGMWAGWSAVSGSPLPARYVG